MKKIVSSLLIAFVLVFAPLNLALASKQSSYYDSLVAPVAALVIGYQQAGRYGAMAGLLVGFVDEALVRTGLTERHYLTAGVLGAGATSAIDWRYAPYLGFAAGSLVATGKLNPIIDKAGLPVSTALVGASEGGMAGAFVGLLCGVVDESVMWAELSKKPYLSNLLYGVAASSALAPHVSVAASKIPYVSALLCLIPSSSLPLAQIVGVGIGGMLSMSEPGSGATTPLHLKDQLHGVLSRIMDEKTLNALMEQQAIVLVASQLTLAKIGLQLTKHFQSMDKGFADLGRAGDLTSAHADFNKALIGLVWFFPFDFAVKAASSFVNSLLSQRTSRAFGDVVFERFASGEVALRLASDPNATVLVEKMDDYLDDVLDGGTVLGSGLQSTTEGVFYVAFLQKAKALDLIVFLDVYNRLISIVTVGIAEWISGYKQALTKPESREDSLTRDILKESNLLIPGDKIELVTSKMIAARTQKRGLEDKMYAVESLQSGTEGMSMSYFAKMYLVGNKIVKKKLAFEDSQPALSAVVSVSNAMSWQSSNAKAIQKISVAIGQLHQLLDKFAEKKAPELLATYKVGASDKVGVRFDNLTVGVENTVLVHVSELFLEQGIYAVTGAQGSGKSAFLSKVKGIQENQFWAKGDITYLTPQGTMPKKMLVTQKDYLAPYSTLLEVIMSKPIHEIDVVNAKPRVLELFKEIGFDVGGDEAKMTKWLDKEHSDWTKLSGGQRKTVAVVSAIMAKPELLILDEVFAGMDKQALANAQRVIKRELPDTLIFVVDHHAQDNNVNGFYTKELHVEDREMVLKSIEATKR